MSIVSTFPGIPGGRLRSLDIFRGLTIAAMILVNNPGNWGKLYAPLGHAPWHGWTPTDLVFPFFLFIVGVAIPVAFAGRMDRQGDGSPIGLLVKILRRSAILFALGLFLNLFRFTAIDFETVRIPGILQRIAIVYAVVASLYLFVGPRARLWLGGLLLAAYTLAMKFVSVPGFGAGDLGAEGNLAGWIDSIVLGKHVWVYAPGPGDPEGLLSTLPAIVTALLGIAVGEWLLSALDLKDKLVGLLVWGNLLLAAGLILDATGLGLPINKNLWTPSYVVFTGGFAMVALAITSYLVDRRPPKTWQKPFEIFGTNAIFAFVGSTLMAKIGILVKIANPDGEGTVSLTRWLFAHTIEPLFSGPFGSLVWAVGYVLFWLGIVWLLYRKRIFLKV